ncbi:ester cyclase [Dactylosporangium sp. CA-092794]|uniref:ester cyclase n=1 Tax=Dactylosporangium sp. CA-092794 TaxID=3239929 RepID=UPI003D8E5EA1
MSDETKRIARAFYEGYNDKDLETNFDAYISPDLVNHALDGRYNRRAWIDFDSTLFGAFENFSLTVLDQVAEGDKVATRYRLGGTQTGEFAGVPAAGNTAYLTATSVDRIAGGVIVEHWTDLDFSGFLEQLSATPAEAR